MKKCVLVIFLLLKAMSGAADPCEHIKTSLPLASHEDLRPVVLGHFNSVENLRVSNIEIAGLWSQGNWVIVSVQPTDAERSYLFYGDSPLASDRYVISWSGFAYEDEEPIIQKWVTDNVSGIPDDLARCFAWYVTRGGQGMTIK